MSTTTRQTTTQKNTRCTPAHPSRWSAEKARTRLARSFNKLRAHSGPSPRAEVEITEE